MSNATLMLHCGAREVTRAELEQVPCPEASGRWNPVPHGTVLTYACEALQNAGYGVERMSLGLSRNDQRFWGTLVLKSTVASGVSLAVAVASSTDKSVSLRWGYGHRVWVCDNGAWSMERTIARKHTTHGVLRYQEAICKAVSELEQYRQQESDRIRRLTFRDVTDTEAESLLLRCYEANLLSPRTLPVAIREWRTPSHVEFEDRNAWSLYNAVTFALGPRAKSNPQAHVAATIRLNGLLTPAEAAYGQAA